MNINWTDVIVVVTILLFIRAGWKYGLVSNVFSGIGLIGGFLVGVYLVEKFYTPGSTEPIVAISAIGLMIGCGLVGNTVLSLFGRLIKIPEGIWQRINSVLGSMFGAAVALAAVWAIGYSITAAPTLSVSQSVKDSQVLKQVDRIMPDRATAQLRGLTKTITTETFPKYLSPFEREVIVEVAHPDDKIVEVKQVRESARSVVQVSGPSKCKKIISGSGFVYAPGLVLTNAHVLAGMTEPTVTLHNKEHKATVVALDTRLDLAVLRVKGLKAPPLVFEDEPRKGDRAAIVGYPKGGELTASAARIRGVMTLKAPDIYGVGEYPREVISVRGQVVPGNSGGALMSSRGTVYGIVFAASSTDKNTGYAITAHQATVIAGKGYTAKKAIPTGECI